MAYKVSYRSAFRKDLKKLPLQVQEYVFGLADKIQNFEIQGEPLKGNYKNFYKVPFGRKPEYRLVYIIYRCRVIKGNIITCKFDDIIHTPEELQTCNGLIEFILVKSREEMNHAYNLSQSQIKRLIRK